MAAGLFLAALIVACLASVIFGSRLERVSAGALVFASFVSVAAERIVSGTFSQPEYGVAAVDVALLGFLLFVMGRSDKFWPIWAVGFHAISVATHLAVLIAPRFLSTPYALYSEWWSLPVVLALIAGCFETPNRLASPATRS